MTELICAAPSAMAGESPRPPAHRVHGTPLRLPDHTRPRGPAHDLLGRGHPNRSRNAGEQLVLAALRRVTALRPCQEDAEPVRPGSPAWSPKRRRVRTDGRRCPRAEVRAPRSRRRCRRRSRIPGRGHRRSDDRGRVCLEEGLEPLGESAAEASVSMPSVCRTRPPRVRPDPARDRCRSRRSRGCARTRPSAPGSRSGRRAPGGPGRQSSRAAFRDPVRVAAPEQIMRRAAGPRMVRKSKRSSVNSVRRRAR